MTEVVMSLSRMASVDYLVGHVAAGDGREPSAGSPMTRYYTAEGDPPGNWIGAGLTSLGAAERAGTEVTEQQLRALFEDARSPLDGTPPGRPPVKYPTRLLPAGLAANRAAAVAAARSEAVNRRVAVQARHPGLEDLLAGSETPDWERRPG